MIAFAIHRKVLAAVPKRTYRKRYYDDGPAGHGAHQRLTMLENSKRARLRKAGKVAPVQYGTLEQALGALK